MALDEAFGKELLAELDTIKSWFSPGSSRHVKVATLADKLAEQVGGRPELSTSDPAALERLATPGPGVRSKTVDTPVTEVESVGAIEEQPADTAETRRAAAKAAADAAKATGEQTSA